MEKSRFCSILLLAMLGVLAQAAEEIPPPTVHDDGRVTFRRFAPAAKNVVLSLEGTKPIPMIKGEDGVWRVTTDSLPPDIYAYYFLVDYVPAGDPSNDHKLPIITGGAQGLVHIPGAETLAWERGDEPQGTIETLDSIRRGRDARAIAGFSMGGAQALFIGLNHPKSFGWVGCMSSAFTLYGGQPESFLSHANETPAEERPELWLSTGTEDFVYGPNKKIVAWLKAHDIQVEFDEMPGGHTWGVWRRALVSFAPSLFRAR